MLRAEPAFVFFLLEEELGEKEAIISGCEQVLRGAFLEKEESLQLRLWNLNSTSNSPVAPRRLSFQISANQREAETSTNVNKH